MGPVRALKEIITKTHKILPKNSRNPIKNYDNIEVSNLKFSKRPEIFGKKIAENTKISSN